MLKSETFKGTEMGIDLTKHAAATLEQAENVIQYTTSVKYNSKVAKEASLFTSVAEKTTEL